MSNGILEADMSGNVLFDFATGKKFFEKRFYKKAYTCMAHVLGQPNTSKLSEMTGQIILSLSILGGFGDFFNHIFTTDQRKLELSKSHLQLAEHIYRADPENIPEQLNKREKELKADGVLGSLESMETKCRDGFADIFNHIGEAQKHLQDDGKLSPENKEKLGI